MAYAVTSECFSINKYEELQALCYKGSVMVLRITHQHKESNGKDVENFACLNLGEVARLSTTPLQRLVFYHQNKNCVGLLPHHHRNIFPVLNIQTNLKLFFKIPSSKSWVSLTHKRLRCWFCGMSSMKLLAPLATQNRALCASTHASRNCLVL